MKKRLVWLTECVHGYEGVCSFECEGGKFEPVEARPVWLGSAFTRSWHETDDPSEAEGWVVEAGK